MALAVMASRSSCALQTLYSSLGGILNPLSKLVRIEGPGVNVVASIRQLGQHVTLGISVAIAILDVVDVDSQQTIPVLGALVNLLVIRCTLLTRGSVGVVLVQRFFQSPAPPETAFSSIS